MAKKVKRKLQRSAPKSGKSIASKISPVTELMQHLVMLVYGRSGTGKTEFGSTFPTPILFLDINERGTETIAHKKNIDLLKVTSWDDIEDAFWYLKEGTKYKSIVIDQMTNLQDLGMAEIRKRAKKGESELFTRKEWGNLSGLLKTTIANFRALADDYNMCFIAHERTFDGGEEEDEALEPSVGARVMPSVGSFIDGAVDAIGSTFIRESYTKKAGKKVRSVDYCMRIGPHAFYSTKVRRPVEAGPLPDFVVDPTHEKIVNLITGKIIPSKKKATKKKVTRRK
ncbi:MAG TPA: AAA family ATPase [Dehalococcoidia bacterium]|nr:AAA family ATPase [Dehalococcoidia bacterium]